ncbi:MAG: acetyl-CoA C-acyltransferase [Rhodospirillaceae bacterium]|nr:acetyl-CoA C-acyltransferase [Rhodospirillaceae bacterium]MYH37847.1 acetyl-CoA C-acyltransferase [Rhodospirillaceae bacterium]MYK16070.1 acetyl-CoA C-acyltransferase [Rhodospirillaceae bacterium]MYK58009.1 acetyl-CoA C-acyltransferase [Rhodospirillaceae bacterium]
MTSATASDPVVIVDGARTPMGSFQGTLKDITATALGAAAIEGALKRSGVAGEDVDEVIMGCVLPAGLGQAPARQAAHGAGIPWDAGCTTVNKMCGSGMKATMLAHDMLAAGVNEVMVAGGLESMTNAPYLMDKARAGLRMGHGKVWDHMFLDGLEDAYEPGRLMGAYAEDTAQHYQFTREAQDDFAITSLKRARAANEDGSFDRETEPVTVRTRKGEVTVTQDEQPFNADLGKIPKLRPAFRKDGTVTPANSSSISDGASALVLTTQSEAEKRGLTPRARIVAHATHAQEPAWFTTAPVGAIDKVLEKAGWTKADVGLYEVNEAFAVVTMAAMKEHGLPHDIVNVHGGACALGHPIGASGARIIVTLLNAMERKGVERGVASLCIGGGEATAIAIERLH